ncbi:hypothetical protein J6590_107635 [Homalodisca vitripennis]|nr:hypothetical protein J6590_107635 [Homalodisca vitripennis]
MQRHNLDEYSPGIFSDLHLGFYNDSKQNIYGSEETGDAKFLHFLSDKQQSISQQKKEFVHYMGKKKAEISDQSAGDLNVPQQKPQWESEISIHCDPDKSYSWDDEAVVTDGSDGDHFYKILQSKAPKAEETASLLDQVVELRAELEERIKDLAIFRKEIHEVGKLMKIDLFQTTGNHASRSDQQNINNHRHTAVLADRVLNSVQQTANKIQTLCTELDSESSP